MQTFQFSKTSSNDIEDVIKYRRKKIRKQQVLYAVILIALLLLLGAYVYRKAMFAEFDGYVKTDVNYQRAADDLFIKDIYVRVGDFIVPGDTLYSFCYMKPILSQIDINTEPDIIVRDRDMRIKYASILEEVQVLRVRIKDLKDQIAVEEHNASLGLSSNSHKLDLQRELNKAEAELKMKLRLLAVTGSARNSVKKTARSSTYDPTSPLTLYDVATDTIGRYKAIMRYRVATDSSLVADISAAEGTCLFHSEKIMTLNPTNIEKSNFTVFVYVPTERVKDIKRDRNITVHFTDDVTATGRFGLVGMRTETLPANLKSTFMRQSQVIMAQVDLADGQELPYWAFANNLPVKVRIPRLKLFGDTISDSQTIRVWYKTGAGLTPKSVKSLEDNRRVSKKNNEKRIKSGLRYTDDSWLETTK